MLNTVSAVLETKGRDYVDKILSDENLVITEKIDTFRILFEKKDGKLIFYKKDNSPITLIERTLTDIWETALTEIPILVEQANIPEDLKFGLYYTPVERPLRIPYKNLPKYILTDVTHYSNNKVKESYNYDNVKEWSGVLCMGRPPVIFQGKLNEVQKKILIDYDMREYDGEDMNFSRMISKTLGSDYSKEEIIEGIIIKSKNKLTQIISYEFDILNEAYQKAHASRDFYDIVILSLNSFMRNYNFPILEGETSDEMYLDIVCDVFNKYCKTNDIGESLEPKYLTPPQYGHTGNLNKKFIKNKDTLKYLAKAPIYEALFRVILSSFRKFKKPFGLLSESVVEKFNTYIYLIKDKINEEINISEVRSENVAIESIKKRRKTDVDNMRVIASIQRAFDPEIPEVNQGEQKCAVYLTSFQPFTNSQLENIKQINKTWHTPVILAAVSNKFKVKGKDFHVSDNIVKAQMKSLANFDSELIPGYMLLDSWDLTEIFEYCRPKYEPIIIITDMGKKSEMALQLFFEEEVTGGRINVESDFNIGEMENKDELQAFRAIEDNNASLFMEMTPAPTHIVFDSISTEYKMWTGAELPQLKLNKF